MILPRNSIMMDKGYKLKLLVKLISSFSFCIRYHILVNEIARKCFGCILIEHETKIHCVHSQKYVSQYVSEIANFSQHLPEAM